MYVYFHNNFDKFCNVYLEKNSRTKYTNNIEKINNLRWS